jgi:hypothetical protein
MLSVRLLANIGVQHLSALSQTLLSFFSQYLPGNPELLTRSRPTYQLESAPCYLLHSFAIVVDAKLDNLNYLRLSRRMGQAKALNDVRQLYMLVDTLWKRVLHMGGCLFSSSENVFGSWWVGHVSFMLAVAVPQAVYYAEFTRQQPTPTVPLHRTLINSAVAMVIGSDRGTELRLSQYVVRRI